MVLKIWQRYFFLEFLKVFFLFLLCFYGLYILIDYASHTSALPHHQLQIHGHHFLRYYFYLFSSRIEILFPIALMVELIKTVGRLNSDRELVAFMASGQSLQQLMRPFIFIAFVCMIFIYLNEQFLLPTALKKLRHIESAHRQRLQPNHLTAQHLILEDGSLLLYQNFDKTKQAFFDLYWVKTIDHIYKMKYLDPLSSPPVGQYVDLLVRQNNGEILQQAYYDKLSFFEMKFSPKVLQSAIVEPNVLPICELAKKIWQLREEMNEKESKLLTAFYWKLTIPWLCLLAVLMPLWSVTRFNRNFSLFFIYIYQLFFLLAFYLYLDAIQVVANRQLLAPFWAILVPYLFLVSLSSWRYFKLDAPA